MDEKIEAFLLHRNQTVCINNIISPPLPVTSGVPQGSVLGPLLFIIYIYDLGKITNLSGLFKGVYLYADDAKLFSDDNTALQDGLETMTTWASKRQLSLAPSKCEHLAIVPKHCKNYAIYPNTYYINSNVISKSTKVKDLGILISNDLKWCSHISNIASTASLCSYQILRSFSSKNIWILLKAFITYVRPKLEYNTVVWSPHLDKDKILIESV